MPSDPNSSKVVAAAPNNSPFKCIYWNVRSISGKKNVKHLQHYIKKKQVDLLFLSETWQRKGHPLPALPGYELISCMSDNVGGRGGVACYFNQEHAAHIEIHKTDAQGHYLWLKLDKALGFEKDVFAAVCYFPPTASTAYKGRDRLESSFPYTNLSNDIGAAGSDFFVVGDFNGRIGDTQGAEAYRHGMARESADKKMNKFGAPLMDVCDKNDLIICNGVTQVWPNSEETTCRSRSVVDYLLAPVSRARHLVKDIEILPLENKSDHNAIHFTLRRPRSSPALHDEIFEAPSLRRPSSEIEVAVPKPPSELQVTKSELCDLTSNRPPPPVFSAVEWTSRLLHKILAEAAGRFRKPVEVPGLQKRGYMTRSFDALTKQPGPSQQQQHCKHLNPNNSNSQLDARQLDGGQLGATEYWSRKVEAGCVSEPVFSLDKLMTANSRPASVASPGLVHVARLSVRADTSCRGQRTDGSRMRTVSGSWGAKGLKMGPGFRCTCMHPGHRVKPGLQIDSVAHPFMKRDSYTRSILVVQPSRFAALLNSLKQAYDSGKLWKSIAQFKLTRKLVKAIK